MKKWLIFILAILLFGSLIMGFGQQPQTKKKLIIGTAPGFYPFQMMDKDGKLIGYNVDLTAELAEFLGVEIEFKGHNGVADLISALQAKQVDLLISGVTITDKRKEVVDFSDPYFESYLSILVNSQYKDLRSWEELDKPDIEIAVTLGSTGDTVASQMFKYAKITRFDTTALAGLELLNGKAAAMIQDDTWTTIYQMYHSSKTSVLLSSNKIGKPSEFGIVVAKGNKGLLDKINVFLEHYKEGGAAARNYEKWFKNDSWKDLVPPQK